MPERVIFSMESGIARVRLNRADKHNALDLAMFEAIAAAQKKARAERAVRVVILDGAGEDFCSGLDVKSMLSNRRAMVRLLWKWLPWQANLAQQVSVGWRRLPVPVIAAIQGRCWGGGLQIALGADFRVAHPAATLSVMEGKWGLIPDMGGTLALRELLQRDQAARIAMTAELLDAPTARDLGLVTAITPDIEQSAMQLATTLCDRSPDAVAAVKRLYRKSWNGSEGSALARETLYQWRILAGENQSIAVRRQRGEDIPFRN
jgi:enoyl-CoA hydratase/carnithine racemase